MQSRPIRETQFSLNSDAMSITVYCPRLMGMVLAAGHCAKPSVAEASVHFSHDISFSSCAPLQLPCTYSPVVQDAEHGRHPGMDISRPVVHCTVLDCCVLRYCPGRQLPSSSTCQFCSKTVVIKNNLLCRANDNYFTAHLHRTHPLTGDVTILYPGWQKQSSSDNASESVDVMPPPLHFAHCT
jgi:hypothetical protein